MMRAECKNPGARASATGVGDAITITNDSNLIDQTAPNGCVQASSGLRSTAQRPQDPELALLGNEVSLSRPCRHAKAAYVAVARKLQDTLARVQDEGTHVFLGFTVLLRSMLSIGERKWLAWSALVSLDPEDSHDVMERVLRSEKCAGQPLPPFLDVQEEADDWAACASPRELWAYALAGLLLLSPLKRAALWRVVKRASKHEQ